MKRVIAGLRLGCQIGAGTGSLTAAFVLLALAGNHNWNHDPAVFLTWGLWATGIGFATGFFVGISIVIKQGREESAGSAPTRHCG
jgi:hypothetical protein